MTKTDMKINNIDDIVKAFNEALEYCRIYGLNWKEHVKPKFENKEMVGYYVIDETGCTTVKTVLI